ncbi:MAG: Histone deacetylase hda1 [Vezdaea aestivalis]|nr:MAG: Histone deacetylase hda1 [Vezdaea aestivalis]
MESSATTFLDSDVTMADSEHPQDRRQPPRNTTQSSKAVNSSISLASTSNGQAILPSQLGSSPIPSRSQGPKSPSTDSPASMDQSNEDEALQHPLAMSSKPSGLYYDPRMRFHVNPDPFDSHPERPERILSIYQELVEAGLVASPGSDDGLSTKVLTRLLPYRAKREEILLVHSDEHYDFIEGTADMEQEELELRTQVGDSVYFHQTSFLCATLSVGGAISCCRAVMEGKVKNAIAVIRPPGHHAETTEPQGFCLFDNVAIAARVCQQEYGQSCRKILILDWDVHHGNGIQQAFYDDPNVLYISLHRWTMSPGGQHFYPGETGSPILCGVGSGIGKNVNIPFSEKNMYDVDYIYAFQEIVMPIALEFDPDFVIIAAGFDAADGDELGSYHVSPPGYAHMTHMLSGLANGKIVVCLEGGYNLHSISTSALAVTRVLMGDPPDRLRLGALSPSAKIDIADVRSIQSKYWQCLTAPSRLDEGWLKEVQADRLQGIDHSPNISCMAPLTTEDIIREFQGSRLYRDHRFVSLPIFRDHISTTFNKQVYASRNYHSCPKLLVIFHDPPDIIGEPNPVTLKIESQNTWVADITRNYVQRAVEQGYGVIDVNIPRAYTDLLKRESRIPSYRSAESLNEELAIYLWENYIEPNEFAKIALMGMGDSYQSLVHLVNHRSEDIVDRVCAFVAFVAENKLVSVTSDMDAMLSSWYHRNSHIYTAADHPAFDPNRRAPKRKFGKLIRSNDTTLSRMMHAHQDEVFEWLQEAFAKEEEIEGGLKPPALNISSIVS